MASDRFSIIQWAGCDDSVNNHTAIDPTFGLMHTVEKSAEIVVKVLSMTQNKRQMIQPDEFRHLAKDFGAVFSEKFLYNKMK